MGRRRAVVVPEERLVAEVTSWSSSYFIGQSGYESPIDDEAITTLECRITEIEKRHQQHLGQAMEISLVCARRFTKDGEERGHPSLYYVTLRKNQRSLLSYLPADTYWSLPGLLTRPVDACIEVSFERLHRGTGALRSLWIGSYEQLVQQLAAIGAADTRKMSQLI